MPTVNDALRERLKNRQQSLSSGFIIENKTFTKGVFRILRNFDSNDEPGFKYVSYFNKQLNVGTTSPLSFGMKCPIDEFLANMKNTASKEDNDIAWKAVQPNTEYWVAVLDMDQPGTVEKPGVRIFRAKRTVYDLILTQMLDEDSGSDICDLEEGRDVCVKKSGQMLDTKWAVTWKSDAPVSDDAEYIEAVRKVANELSVPQKFYKVDWDKLGQLYANLTGDEMPDHYREQEGSETKPAVAAKGKAKVASKPAATGKAKPAPAAPAEPEEPEVLAVDPDDAPVDGGPAEGIELGATRVSFVGENDATVEGKIVGYTAETAEYDVEDAGGEIWSMGLTDFTVLEDEAPVKAGPKKKVAGKKPEPVKPAPVAAKPAATGVPKKPGTASSGIRSKLAGK